MLHSGPVGGIIITSSRLVNVVFLLSDGFSSSVVFVFSIVGAVRTGSYMFHVLSISGFRRSICDQSFYNGPVSKFWAYAFVLSKAPELGQFLHRRMDYYFCLFIYTQSET